MTRILCSATLSLLACAVSLAAQGKTPHFENDLRVLLVANDPNAPTVGMAERDRPRTLPLLRERAAAWEALLRYHFANLTVVYGADYRADLSSEHDVTIFDTRPKALVEAVRGTDPETGKRTYQPPEYLPANFDRAAITIADNSPRIGEPLGLKLDWL